MPDTTPIYGLPFPELSDPADISDAVQPLAEAVEALFPLATADLGDATVTSAKLESKAIHIGSFTKINAGASNTVGANASFSVTHNLGLGAQVVLLTPIGIGLADHQPLNYDLPSGTVFRVFNNNAFSVTFCWVAIG